MKRLLLLTILLLTACAAELPTAALPAAAIHYDAQGLHISPSGFLVGAWLELTGGTVVRADARCTNQGSVIRCELGDVASPLTIRLQGQGFTACLRWNGGSLCKDVPL